MDSKCAYLQWYYNAWKTDSTIRSLSLSLYGWGGVCVLMFRSRDSSSFMTKWHQSLFRAAMDPKPGNSRFWCRPWRLCLWKIKEKKWEGGIDRCLSVHACKTVSLRSAFQLCIKYKATTTKGRKAFGARQSHIPAGSRGNAADGQFFHFVVVDAFLHGDDILLTLKCLDIWQKVTLYRLKFTPRFRPDPSFHIRRPFSELSQLLKFSDL